MQGCRLRRASQRHWPGSICSDCPMSNFVEASQTALAPIWLYHPSHCTYPSVSKACDHPYALHANVPAKLQRRQGLRRRGGQKERTRTSRRTETVNSMRGPDGLRTLPIGGQCQAPIKLQWALTRAQQPSLSGSAVPAFHSPAAQSSTSFENTLRTYLMSTSGVSTGAGDSETARYVVQR